MSGFFSQSTQASKGGYDSHGGDDGTAKKPTADQTLRAVTIKQINTATILPDSKFKIDDAEVANITFVATIRKVTEQASSTNYTVEDGTGAIDVVFWGNQTDTEEILAKRREMTVNTYVRVFGRPHSFGKHTNCSAFTVRPIVDFNEIAYHFIECVHSHLTFTKSSKSSDIQVVSSGNANTSGRALNDQIISYIESCGESSDGVHIEDIINKLRGLHTATSVRTALENLTNEGHCYTTSDDYHFKSTANY
ncbi:hypothetical protein J3Q64DRAFT_1743744 [Phycomyces blakesleeanus]|uniref:Replication protein A C-terminal domain-containing protein n=2 Tax=Phycomyces blakesleeanus TaxID=4837 RepID=A0A162NDE4_PHYB8|nr:hypothetical protein PHYBLDRAFT_56018 [Phycomyces blakesleeanus NRRL 1555(-)]OAD73288.1 hypothetical protein PHYBLDRAFT_56018 [Phycomyces blakesleeanus NRRL 1555(-)]|eukprot:XP_018291328.1 hypothetical protein PHYBLDRAFT_56018 [Phycomyces blakesleeanus NRRL 1555(-)]